MIGGPIQWESIPSVVRRCRQELPLTEMRNQHYGHSAAAKHVFLLQKSVQDVLYPSGNGYYVIVIKCY